MATARPFAFNPGPNISGTIQVGDLSVGTPTSGFTSSPQFWNGPDEELGYVIAIPVSGNTQPTQISGVTASVGFFRTDGFNDGEFIQLAETVSNEFGNRQSFSTALDASVWLTNNGFWNSFIPVFVTPTPSVTTTQTNTPTPTNTTTTTSTPTSTQAAGLLINLDSGNLISYPGTGTTWYDLAGTANNATLFNSPTYSSSYNGILQFDDASLEYGTIPNIGSLSNWTVEVWFRLTTALTGKVTSIVSNQFDLVNKLNFSIGTNNAPSNYNLSVGYFNGAWRTTTGFVPQTNVWYQVVGTYDGSTIRQYVNGSASGGTLSYVGTSQSGGEVRLMRRWDETLSSGNLVDGDLAIVKIYNTALSSSDILQSYNNTYTRFLEPTPTPTTTSTPTVTPTNTTTSTPTPTSTPNAPITSNLVLYYDPSNPSSYSGTGTVINDLSGNGLSGTMSNITFTSPYFSYNGSSSQISVADNALLEPGSGDWSIEFWVNHSVIAGASRILIAKTDGGNSADWGYGLRTVSNSNTFIEVGNGTTSVTSPSTGLSINTWYQVVGVWTNVASNSIALYINGSLIGSNSHSFTSIKNTTSPLYLGSFNGGQFSQWLNGRMGVVRMYNKALTGSEVLQNFDADKSKYGL